jgi:hypothetical protein
MKTLSGSCLCNQVQFEIPDDFTFMGNCHCSQCRKFTGSDYSSVGGVPSEKFQLTAGEEFITLYRKNEETELAFCKCCGSSLFSKKLVLGLHNVRLGVLNDTPTHKPTFHIFTGSKAPWNDILDDLKQFETRPSKA